MQYQTKYKNVVKSQLPPHLYALADSAYQQMNATQRDQCFVIRCTGGWGVGGGRDGACKAHFSVASVVQSASYMHCLGVEIAMFVL